MANGLPINHDTFKNLKSLESKIDALFDVLVFMNSAGYESEADRKEKRSKCNERFQKLEKSKHYDKIIAGGTGFIGGFAAFLSKTFFGS
jgi:hypothetical protein